MTKISALPQDTAPALTDPLLGNDATVTSRFELQDVLAIAPSLKAFQPRNVRISMDFCTQGTNVSTASHANTTTWYPFFIPEPCTLDQLDTEVGTLEVGSVTRLGLYTFTAATAAGATGDLITDYGTVSGDTTGVKSISSIGESLTRGMYMFCAASSSHTLVRWRRNSGGLIASVFPGSFQFCRRTAFDHSGALPSTITATAWTGGSTNNCVQVLGTFT